MKYNTSKCDISNISGNPHTYLQRWSVLCFKQLFELQGNSLMIIEVDGLKK